MARSDKGIPRGSYKDRWFEEGERHGRSRGIRDAALWAIAVAFVSFLAGFAISRSAAGQHDLMVNLVYGLITTVIGQLLFNIWTKVKAGLS